MLQNTPPFEVCKKYLNVSFPKMYYSNSAKSVYTDLLEFAKYLLKVRYDEPM